jgi:hypothetical protein
MSVRDKPWSFIWIRSVELYQMCSFGQQSLDWII